MCLANYLPITSNQTIHNNRSLFKNILAIMFFATQKKKNFIDMKAAAAQLFP